ncbi:MAG: cation:proton antiporter, partial [Candidatus Limnocylindrales bacterium]
LGKLVGSGIGARLGGLDGRSSVLVGTGMIARGEVALVAASLGLQAGAIGPAIYAAVVMVALATTVITPLGISLWVRWTTRRPETSRSSRPSGVGEAIPELARPMTMATIEGELGR